MARKRMIDPSIWQDEGMAELTPRQQLLYIGLFSNADDEGRLKGSESALRLILPTLYAGVGLAEIGADVAAVLACFRELVRYEVDGRVFMAFRNYRRWQKIDKPSPSPLPPPPDPDEDSTSVRGTLVEESTTVPAQQNRREEEEKGTEEKHIAGAGAPATDDDPLPPPKFPKPKERPPDRLFESVCTACRIDWHRLTDRERGKVNVAVKQIRDAGGTPENVAEHAANYEQHFTTTLTPMALAGNWAQTARPPSRAAPTPLRRKPTLQDRNDSAFEEAFGDEPEGVRGAIEATFRSHEQRPIRPPGEAVVAEIRRR